MATLQRSDRGGEQGSAATVKLADALEVERVTHQDVPAICALYKKVWEGNPEGLPAELVKAWQPTPLEFTSWMEGVTYFAARRGGRLVGVVGCKVAQGNCQLVHLAVDPETRRQGVATALIAAALEWAKHANAAVVWGDTLARITGATALLKHLGFSECGLLHKHQLMEDVVLFERLL